MKQTILSLVLIVASLALVGFGISGGGASLSVREGSSVPSDTTVTHIDTDDGHVYHYHSWADSLWLDGGEDLRFLSGGAGVTGALKMGHNVECDTTTLQANGYWFPDSTLISEIHFGSDGHGNVTACTLDVYVNRLAGGPSLIDNLVIGTKDKHDTTNMRTITPDSVRISMYIRTGATNVDDVMIRMRAHKFINVNQ